MKTFLSLLMLVTLIPMTGCNRSDVGDDDEVQIERQEDYNREDASETEVVPVHKDDEVKIQNDDEVDIDD